MTLAMVWKVAVIVFVGYAVILGFVYVVVMRPKSLESIRLAVLVVIVGTILFFVRRRFGSHQSA